MRRSTSVSSRALLGTILALGLGAGLLGVCPGWAQGEASEYVREDPAKIRTAAACGECHVEAYEVWKRTPHATGFKTLHRKAAAETIAKKLGFRLIKRESLCLSCHYTPVIEDDQLRAASGVSCESCHGAARDWINVHNDYGGKGIDHRSESPAHRTARIERSRRAGMRRPSDLYPLVASCFECHTVPLERLVNVGGHSTGSGDFELVERTQGEIRHNFLQSFLTGGTENSERAAERKRVMYVVGRTLDLEYSLRGVAAATEEGVYLKAMIRRARVALSEVRAIAGRGSLPEVEGMVATVRGVDVTLNNRAALLAAAEKIGEAARQFIQGHDGTRLAGLDPLILGTAEEDAYAEEPAAPAAAEVALQTETTGSTGTSPASAPGGRASGASRPRGGVPAVGEFKRRVRPASRFKTVGPARCTSCHRHQPQNAWWLDDKHYTAADPFFEQDPKNVRIARLYGLNPAQMSRGDQICMDCHGTVVSGKERREVQDAVSCESCHGPAAQYLEPHQEGEKNLSEKRPGYVKALGLGMHKLRDPEVQAEICTGCHYVTEPRLISAGHPSGAEFDYPAGIAKIKHWQRPTASPATLKAAFRAELATRGPVPKVQLARLAESRGASAAGDVGTANVSPAAQESTGSIPPRPPRPRPLDPAASAAVVGSGELGLPPFPEIDASTPVEALLLLLKQRLDQLYRAVGQEP